MWEHVKEKYNAEFYFFNRFPFKIKPFYVMAVDEDPKYARSVDLNFRGFELSSGGQREHRFEKIVEHVREKGMDYESVEWFAKFFQWGCPPHGGFAIGIERLTQSLLNLENIRQAVLFPRDPTRRLP
jgi:aspartyl-tRNA synthetase